MKALEKIQRREFSILEAPPSDRKRVEQAAHTDELTRGINGFQETYADMLLRAGSGTLSLENDRSTDRPPPQKADVKLIAFYLPQYHPIPENDRWWGRGFTDWVNVSKAVPQFVGHHQPRLPGELGFYDLRVLDVQKRQIELAREHGIFGFCFYYYWFNGRRLLEKPLDQFLSHPELEFPFCLCWVNQNWTRQWDGLDKQILLQQTYPAGWNLRFIRDIGPSLSDRRYIRINNRPLLIVYDPAKLPSSKAVLKEWRDQCRESGLGELYIAGVQSRGFVDPGRVGLDAVVEFPPRKAGDIRLAEITNEVNLLNPSFSGKIFDYRELVHKQLSRADKPSFDLFLGVMTGWDNEPRRVGRGTIYAFSTPALYAQWLRHACQRTITNMGSEKRLVFINAWNEWAEGAHLEPDRKNGYSYLQATSAVLRTLTAKSDMASPRERLHS